MSELKLNQQTDKKNSKKISNAMNKKNKKDIVSMWVEVGQIPGTGSKVKNGLCFHIEYTCFGRHN